MTWERMMRDRFLVITEVHSQLIDLYGKGDPLKGLHESEIIFSTSSSSSASATATACEELNFYILPFSKDRNNSIFGNIRMMIDVSQ
jgi:hypothetical protein